MLSYQLLLRFDTHGPFRKCEGSEFLRDLRGLRPEVLDSPHVRFALDVRREYAADNAAGFFRLLRSKRCSYLQACCLHNYVRKMRLKTLEIFNKTLNKSPLPMDIVGRDLLRCKAEEARELAERCGLAVNVFEKDTEGRGDDDEKVEEAVFLAVKEAAYVRPAVDSDWPSRRSELVDKKAPSTKSGIFRWEALITGRVGC